MRIVYIAGPVTGIPDYKRPFDVAQGWLVQQGYVALNPTMLPEGLKNHGSYMNICLPMLNEADAILLLPGWKDSKGAMMEYEHAKMLNLPMYQADFDDYCRFQFMTRMEVSHGA